MTRIKLKTVLAISALAFAAAPALAADDHKGHDHDEMKGAAHPHGAKPRYGGTVSVVKDVNYELGWRGSANKAAMPAAQS